jgi:hypothetical protein
VHVARGELEVAGRRLRAGDALECSDEPRLEFSRGLQAEVLVFDLP